MVIKDKFELADFLIALREAKGDVYLKSDQGDCFNLKSEMAKFIALGAIMKDHAEDLELYCARKEDEYLFYHFFDKHPDAL